jgi:NTE family protein
VADPRQAIETAGTSVRGLIKPCPANGRLAPTATPSRPDAFALSFSGGGWRAALTAAGTLRFMADAGLLGQVRWLSSVSGGSITNGLFAHAYNELRGRDFDPESIDRAVITPLLRRARDQSLTWTLIRNAWRALGPRNRTEVMARIFDRWFYSGRPLHDLTQECRFVFNAANATSGVRFEFTRERVGDYVTGYLPAPECDLTLGDAVAASAAVPGAFAAMRLRELDFPCGKGDDVRLLDGGVYDNLGLEAIDDLHGPCLVIVSAGGVLRRGMQGLLRFIPIVRDLKRSEELLYRQATALRARAMVERFQAWERTPQGAEPPANARKGILFGLGTTMKKVSPDWLEGRREELPGAINRTTLAESKTTFSKRSPGLCRDLIYRGWWLTGAELATFHPEVLGQFPTWRPLPI